MDGIKNRYQEESKKPMIAGILMIIAFLLAVYQAAGIFLIDTGSMDIQSQIDDQVDQNIDMSMIDTILNICGALMLIFGLFLLLGGIFAIKRVHWMISLTGSILGIFTIGPMFAGSIMSLIALVLLFLAKDEFKGKGDKLQKDEQFDQFEKQTEF